MTEANFENYVCLQQMHHIFGTICAAWWKFVYIHGFALILYVICSREYIILVVYCTVLFEKFWPLKTPPLAAFVLLTVIFWVHTKSKIKYWLRVDYIKSQCRMVQMTWNVQCKEFASNTSSAQVHVIQLSSVNSCEGNIFFPYRLCKGLN